MNGKGKTSEKLSVFRSLPRRAHLDQLGVKTAEHIHEVPGVYKDIAQVMAAQADLVDVIARFDPKIVRMADEGEKPED